MLHNKEDSTSRTLASRPINFNQKSISFENNMWGIYLFFGSIGNQNFIVYFMYLANGQSIFITRRIFDFNRSKCILRL